MLSAANMFLMGVIDAQPISPYEIVSRFAYNRYKDLLNIADSTIYANISAMCRKGYIEFELVQESSLPPKKMYTTTKAGCIELENSIRAYLRGEPLEKDGFMVALLLMHHVSKEEICQLLDRRLERMAAFTRQREDEYLFVQETSSEVVPCFPNVASSLYVYELAKAEMKSVTRIRETLQKEEVWPQDTFATTAEYTERYAGRSRRDP